MKQVTEEYKAREEAVTRQPVELYRVNYLNESWYMCSGDRPFQSIYDSVPYNPAPIVRGSISYDQTFKIVTCDITISALDQTVAAVISRAPIANISVEILRGFYNDLNIEPVSFFYGDVMSVSSKGLQASFKVGSFERYLRKTIPGMRVQNFCNWTFGDANCDADAAGDVVSDTITEIDATGTYVTVPGVSLFDTRFWGVPYGLLSNESGSVNRMITEYIYPSTVRLAVPAPELQVGDAVTVRLGCDGSILRCARYENAVNFGGHPELPLDNPCWWF